MSVGGGQFEILGYQSYKLRETERGGGGRERGRSKGLGGGLMMLT